MNGFVRFMSLLLSIDHEIDVFVSGMVIIGLLGR